jgi:hypothetical protein
MAAPARNGPPAGPRPEGAGPETSDQRAGPVAAPPGTATISRESPPHGAVVERRGHRSGPDGRKRGDAAEVRVREERAFDRQAEARADDEGMTAAE